MADYIGAIDQGTTSSRFIVFDKDGRIVTVSQKEHEQITPKAGWVEHDANEIWRRTREVIGAALADSDLEAGDIHAIGITNQRETTVVWDRESGEPIHNAIVWQDTRTDAIVRGLGDGDQQAALFGQTCFDRGDAKNTYGTGSFLLVNTGEELVHTDKLLTSVGYKLGDGKATYVLEGSIAVTGALIQWLRDRLKIIGSA